MLDRPGSAGDDPVEHALALLRLERAKPVRLEAGGTWGVAFAPYPHAKFTIVLRGTCWLSGEGLADPVKLRAGDGYLLANGRPYRLGSRPDGPAADGSRVIARAGSGPARVGTGDEVTLVGGSLVFGSPQAHLLLDALPPLVVMRGDAEGTGLVRLAVELIARESDERRFGSALVVDRLADVLLVQAVREVTQGRVDGATGWLAALADPEIGRALRLMHGDLARRWTLPELASAVGLSRSSFAERFRRLVGRPPLEYLSTWRMAAAGEALRQEGRTVASVAAEWGYASESAFSAAFKRVMHVPPARYRAAPSAAAA
jgi:AraC-like DNA-binding protein